MHVNIVSVSEQLSGDGQIKDILIKPLLTFLLRVRQGDRYHFYGAS